MGSCMEGGRKSWGPWGKDRELRPLTGRADASVAPALGKAATHR